MKILYALILCVGLFTINAQSQIKKIPVFSLKNIDSKYISLADFKSQKGIILTFVSNVCPVAELYQPRIEALHKKYAPKGFPVVAIDPVDAFEEMKDTALSRDYSYSFLYDSTQNIARSYKVKANTHTFILLSTSAGFKIVYEGAIDDDYSGENVSIKYIENTVDALLNKKPIRIVETKVTGCPVHYRK
jgi:peroxiredoxin